jgi:hypothetical protein
VTARLAPDWVRHWAWAALVTLVLAPACHHSAAKDPDSFIGRAQATSRQKVTPAGDALLPPPLRSYAIATVPEKSVGPFLARSNGVAMGAYLGPGDGGTRRVVALPMAQDGAPKQARVVAPTLADSTTLVLRPAGGDHGAFVAAWTELTDRGEALSVAGVGPDGAATIPPVELTRTTDDIVWVEIAPTTRGEICVWAEETKSSDANILAVALDPSGKPRGVPSRVARGVTAWQVVPTLQGAGLALVSSAKGKPGGPGGLQPATTGSSIDWLKLDSEGRPVGPATPVATSTAKVTDIDLAAVRDSVVFAWTDRSEPDPTVWLAAIDGEGKQKPPHPVTARSGGAKLSAIGGGKSSGLLVWEEARKRPRPQRHLHVARVDADGSLATDASTVIEADTSGVPEIAPLDAGFAVLVRARTCADPAGPNDPPCSEAPIVPLLLRLDLALRVSETEPIRIDEGQEVATLAWGLSCEEGQCLVLAAGQESPAKVRAVLLTEMPNRWRPPIAPSTPSGAPKVLGVDTLQAGDLFADVAVTPTDEGVLAATITSSAEEPAQGGPPRGATVSVRALDAAGAARGPVQTLTKRGLSVGGVSIAAGGQKTEGAAVAWLAREGGKSQVHVSRVDRLGRRTKDVQLTTTSGDATEAAIAWAGGGWLVSWVDTRDGNGEVYATKIDVDLNRVAREERITNAPGDASDVALLTKGAGGGDVWLAWADPRESPRDGFADIFVARLSAISAKPTVPEARVMATAAHSRSPVLGWGEAGRVDIAWIEEAPMSSGSDNSGAYGALIGSLDEQGHLVGDVVKTHGASEGFPTSVAIERSSAVLRVVLARAARDDLSLDVLELSKDHETQPSLLYMLDGPPSLDVSLSLLGGAAYFNDEGVEVGDGRARRVSVSWGP